MKRTEFSFNFDSKIYHKKPLIARERPKEIKIEGVLQKGLTKNPLKTPLIKSIAFFIICGAASAFRHAIRTREFY